MDCGNGRPRATTAGGLGRARRDVELEQARGVEAERLGALLVVETTHGPLDGLRRVRPRALVMRIVVAPHETVAQAVALGQLEPGGIFLERREAVGAQVFAR